MAPASGDTREVTRKQEFKKRTKVVERVFERSARQEETSPSAEGTQGYRILRTAILNMLRFVGDHTRELDASEQRLVARQGAITGDHQIASDKFGGGRNTFVSMMNKRAKLRGETYSLTPPVFEERCRAHHQRRVARILR